MKKIRPNKKIQRSKPANAQLSQGQGNNAAGYPIIVSLQYHVIQNGKTAFALKGSLLEIETIAAKIIPDTVEYNRENLSELEVKVRRHTKAGKEDTDKVSAKLDLGIDKIGLDPFSSESKKIAEVGIEASYAKTDCLISYEGINDEKTSAFWTIHATSGDTHLGNVMNNQCLVSVAPNSENAKVSLILTISEKDIVQREGYSLPFSQNSNKFSMLKAIFKKKLAGRYLATQLLINTGETK